MDWILDWTAEPEAWIALGTLTALEIVLGLDNIIFITILTERLPLAQRPRARLVGLVLAMLVRILLLSMLRWIMQLQTALFAVFGNDISGRDLILIGGGLFLLAKATLEIHAKLEGDHHSTAKGRARTFAAVLVQIALLDIVFSIDSVVTAVGMADRYLVVMILAIVTSVIFMVLFVNMIARFIERHPTFKILALSFLLLIGIALVGEGLDLHIPKGYLYFGMGFSLFTEILNTRMRRDTGDPVHLRGPDVDPPSVA